MSESTPRVGQVRQRYDVETTTQGAGLTQQHHPTGVTSEAWTGSEWVDVRELVAAQETVRRVEAIFADWERWDAGRKGRGWPPASRVGAVAVIRRVLDGDV